jgi:hypothetical protein
MTAAAAHTQLGCEGRLIDLTVALAAGVNDWFRCGCWFNGGCCLDFCHGRPPLESAPGVRNQKSEVRRKPVGFADSIMEFGERAV